MYRTQERVATEFLVDDINDLIRSHTDLLDSYRDAVEKSRSNELKRLFTNLSADHQRDQQRLAELVSAQDGDVARQPDAGRFGARLRLIFGSLLSDASMVRAMHTGESKLLQEYTRSIRNLVKIDGLEAVLESNRLAIQKRMAKLEVTIGLD